MSSMRARRAAAVGLVLAAAVAIVSACGAAAAPKVSPAAPRKDAGVDMVIQGAIDAEVDPLVESLSDAKLIQIGAWTFWRGHLAGRDVVVSRTEVGPINAVASTVLAINTFHPRMIINQGTAGATVPSLRVLDIVVGEATVDYGGFRTKHMEAGEGSDPAAWIRMPHRLRFEGDERITLPVFPGDPDLVAAALSQPNEHGRVVKGIIGSAFEFNQEVDRLTWIHKKYDAVSEDMESAFAAGAALGLNTPFVAVRIISDSDFQNTGVHPNAAEYCAKFVARLAGRVPRTLPLTRPSR
jgi:adenosylhomocysteine nucleosidase